MRPILKTYCFDCHGEGKELEASLDLRLQRFMVKGSESGPSIIPGKPKEGLLIERIKSKEMPPGEVKLEAKHLTIITRWIEQGAKTAGLELETLAKSLYITEAERNFWAFQRIKNAKVPTVSNKSRVFWSTASGNIILTKDW